MEEFDVIFLDEDKKTVLASLKVQYGATAKFPGNIPTKDSINGVKYHFIGWEGEEKLATITENTIVFAKYETETNTLSSEEALLQASLSSAEKMNYNVIVEAGQKALAQQQAFEKDNRTAEQIVNDIKQNGKTELGQEIDKNFEK